MDNARWDMSLPGFATAVLYCMLGLGLAVSAVGAWLFPAGTFGLLAGAFIAVMLYLTAMRAGHQLLMGKRYAVLMASLLGHQLLLWIGVGVIMVPLKVNPVGFVLGVTILPVAIVLTMIWYVLHARRA